MIYNLLDVIEFSNVNTDPLDVPILEQKKPSLDDISTPNQLSRSKGQTVGK